MITHNLEYCLDLDAVVLLSENGVDCLIRIIWVCLNGGSEFYMNDESEHGEFGAN